MTKPYQWTLSLVVLRSDFGRAASQLEGINKETEQIFMFLLELDYLGISSVFFLGRLS